MKILSVYPVILTTNVEATARFYQEHFRFEVTFAADWYISLKNAQNPAYELAVLQADHPTVPEGFRRPSQGLLINIEVEDATQIYNALSQKEGVTMLRPLKDEAFGQRHFLLEDPSGNMVDVIQNIEPSAEFADQFSDG